VRVAWMGSAGRHGLFPGFSHAQWTGDRRSLGRRGRRVSRAVVCSDPATPLARLAGLVTRAEGSNRELSPVACADGCRAGGPDVDDVDLAAVLG